MPDKVYRLDGMSDGWLVMYEDMLSDNDRFEPVRGEGLCVVIGKEKACYGVPKFDEWRRKYSLDGLAPGVDVPLWLKRKRERISEIGASCGSGAFADDCAGLRRFCGAHGIGIEDVHDLAMKMKPLSADGDGQRKDRLRAMEVAAALLYFSQVAAQHPEVISPKFVEAILKDIRAGKLKVKDALKQDHPTAPPKAGNYLSYFHEGNELWVSVEIDLENPVSRSDILHEINHFQQDISAKLLSREQTETDTYLFEGSYLLWEFSRDRVIKNLADLMGVIGGNSRFGDRHRRTRYGLLASYSRAHGDEAGFKQNLAYLQHQVNADFLMSYTGRKTMHKILASFNEVMKKMAREESTIAGFDARVDKLRRRLDLEKPKAFDALRGIIAKYQAKPPASLDEANKDFPAALDLAIKVSYGQVALDIVSPHHRATYEGKDAGRLVDVNLSGSQADRLNRANAELADLRPASGIYRYWSGVDK